MGTVFFARRLDHHALAAVNLNMPIFLLLCAVGCLLGVGASVSASRALGRNDTEAASDSYHSAILWALILSAIFMFIGFFLHDETA